MARVTQPRIAAGLPRISQREAEVLAAVGEQLSNAQIASRLHLSVRTVETHVSSLLRKLAVTDRRALAGLAPRLSDGSTASGAVRGLPPFWTPFVGRTAEQQQLRSALDGARLVTLLGPGGAGKTRLAAVVAADIAAGLPLGATFVELVSTRPGFLTQTVAAALGVTERPAQQLRDSVVDRLRTGRSLLVLDNCEHLVDEAAEFLTALLGATQELVVLTTSRERIGVPGERVVPLGGLALVAQATGGAAGSEAVTLFFERARALDAGFDADPAQVGELCAQLDGLPLAIELATARTATLGVSGLRAGLGDRLRLLTGGRGVETRHRSLRAVLDWSHDLLSDDERSVLRRLGRFAGDFDIPAAGQVTGIPVAALADAVGRLTDKSLLVHRRSRGGERWALLESVRAYALDKLEESGEVAVTTARYVDWALGTARAIEVKLDSDDPWRADFDAVADDLRAALELAPDDASAAPLARVLGHVCFARRFLGEARGHYVTAAERADDDRQAARDLWSAASVAQVENNGTLEYRHALEAAQRAAAAGDRGTQAAVLAEAVANATRFPAIFAADVPLEELRALLATARDVAPALNRTAQAQVAAAEAWTQTRLVEVPDVAPFRAAYAAAREADDPILMSAALDALGAAQVMAGRLRDTFELGNDRLALLDRLPGHEPSAGSEIHDILHMAVENAISAGELRAALDVADRFDEDDLVAAAPQMAISKPIVALALMGRFDEAIERGHRVREQWTRSGEPPARWLAPGMYAVVLCLELIGQHDVAAEWREFAGVKLAGAQTRNVHFQVGGMLTFVEARLALHEGRLADAGEVLAAIPLGARSWWEVRHWYFDAYPWALAADVAAAAGAADAPARIAVAQAPAAENRWAAACVARARARLSGDPRDFAESLAGWERIEARYERASTLLLMPDRADEGRTELADLGVQLPASTG
jgi:predicted ATPase/DNA-binding CsgD family transcriptional regulator